MTDPLVSKTTFTFTVLHRTDQHPSSLEDAMQESYDGHMVGWETSRETRTVDDGDVTTELMTLGNDGSFFDDDFAEAAT